MRAAHPKSNLFKAHSTSFSFRNLKLIVLTFWSFFQIKSGNEYSIIISCLGSVFYYFGTSFNVRCLITLSTRINNSSGD